MNDDPLPALRALNAKFIHNFVTNDVPSHDAILHERFRYIGSNGARQDRTAYLARWATGFDPDVLVYWDIRDERIDVFGDAALVCSVNKWIVAKDGKETSGMSLYTDAYVRENGGWKCIQAQITGVQPDQYPGDETIIRKYVRGKIVG
ncbi:MAG: nuclear transport factor 2 family protein [Proteobacteria bacterium]|nr:nuclear transport factor 2 family protein [Pseudomonadota bacterium]